MTRLTVWLSKVETVLKAVLAILVMTIATTSAVLIVIVAKADSRLSRILCHSLLHHVLLQKTLHSRTIYQEMGGVGSSDR